ncbi:hypothetical protein Trydic_g20488 [Trypoxylus dichotomus]
MWIESINDAMVIHEGNRTNDSIRLDGMVDENTSGRGNKPDREEWRDLKTDGRVFQVRDRPRSLWDRKSVRTIVRLLTGHYMLEKYTNNLHLTAETVCRFFQSVEKTGVHMLAGIQLTEVDSQYPKPESHVEGSLTRLLDLVRKAKLT